jgi:endonuclease/exonuclease/phosphatase (EEP) superfamily protein YafD
VAEIVDDLATDVIALHEVTPEQAKEIILLIEGKYPYRILDPEEEGQGLIFLSRYPIDSYEFFRIFPRSRSSARVVINVDGTQIVVYAAHLQSPRGGMSPFNHDTSGRNADAAYLRDRIAAETDPVLILCDCNMSDQSDAYRSLDKLLDDAFREVGQGLGFTYRFRRYLPFMVRIDYVWHSDHFVALDARILEDSGSSDHRPMVATVALRQDE